MPGKARWGEIWWVEMGLGERKRYAIVSENGWNDTFPRVLAVSLTTSPRRRPGPGFPLVAEKPRTIAVCGEIMSIPEHRLVERVGALTPAQMRAVAIGLLEVTQAHRLLGMHHPAVAERVGRERRR